MYIKLKETTEEVDLPSLAALDALRRLGGHHRGADDVLAFGVLLALVRRPPWATSRGGVATGASYGPERGVRSVTGRVVVVVRSASRVGVASAGETGGVRRRVVVAR